MSPRGFGCETGLPGANEGKPLVAREERKRLRQACGEDFRSRNKVHTGLRNKRTLQAQHGNWCIYQHNRIWHLYRMTPLLSENLLQHDLARLNTPYWTKSRLERPLSHQSRRHKTVSLTSCSLLPRSPCQTLTRHLLTLSLYTVLTSQLVYSLNSQPRGSKQAVQQ